MLKLAQSIFELWSAFSVENKIATIGVAVAILALFVAASAFIVPIILNDGSEKEFHQVSLKTLLDQNKVELKVCDVDLLMWSGAKEEFVTIRLSNDTSMSAYDILTRIRVGDTEVIDSSHDLNMPERDLLKIFKNISLPGQKVEQFPLVTKTNFIKNFKISAEGFILLGVGVSDGEMSSQRTRDAAKVAISNALLRANPDLILNHEVDDSAYSKASLPFEVHYEWKDTYGRKYSMRSFCYSYWLKL